MKNIKKIGIHRLKLFLVKNMSIIDIVVYGLATCCLNGSRLPVSSTLLCQKYVWHITYKHTTLIEDVLLIFLFVDEIDHSLNSYQSKQSYLLTKTLFFMR